MSIDIQSTVKNLHPLEVKVILSYRTGDELTVARIEKELNIKSGNQALAWLAGKGIVTEIRREPSVFYELTGLGSEWKEKGCPEERMLRFIQESHSAARKVKLPDIAAALKMENKDIGSAFGSLSKSNIL